MTSPDHEQTDEIVCPHCGHEHEDSYEILGDGGKLDCEACGRPFLWDRDTTVTYTTEKVEA